MLFWEKVVLIFLNLKYQVLQLWVYTHESLKKRPMLFDLAFQKNANKKIIDENQ